MPRSYAQPSPMEGIPRSSYEAFARLEHGMSVRVAPRTDLTRTGITGRCVNYAGRMLVRYGVDGDVTIFPQRDWSRAEFVRIVPVLPHGWSGLWRGSRRNAQLVYRGVYTMAWMRVKFCVDGRVEFGNGRGSLTLDELNREADHREGVTPMRSRRRVPRPYPSYAVRASVAWDEAPGPDITRYLRPRRAFEFTLPVDTPFEEPSPEERPEPPPAAWTFTQQAPVLTTEQVQEWVAMFERSAQVLSTRGGE